MTDLHFKLILFGLFICIWTATKKTASQLSTLIKRTLKQNQLWRKDKQSSSSVFDRQSVAGRGEHHQHIIYNCFVQWELGQTR